MRISDLNPSGINGLSPGSASPASGISAYGQGGRGTYGQTGDHVQLSSASRLAASVLASHSARLTELRSLVASGQYDPPAAAVAKSLVSEALFRTPKMQPGEN